MTVGSLGDAWDHHFGGEPDPEEIGEEEELFADALDDLGSGSVAPGVDEAPMYDDLLSDPAESDGEPTDTQLDTAEWLLENAEEPEDDGPLGIDLPGSNPVPWWVKYAAGGIGLVVLLIVLSPYAEIGAEVVS